MSAGCLPVAKATIGQRQIEKNSSPRRTVIANIYELSLTPKQKKNNLC